jgi:hypothetical protein
MRHVVVNDGCWLWMGAKFWNGYGCFRIDPKGNTMNAHRAAWKLFVGAIAPKLQVCHRCDVRACVNPSHLFLGTTQENTADKYNKGRQARGDKHGMSKLTEDDVRLILSLHTEGWSAKEIAEWFGVTYKTTWLVTTRRSWRHIREDRTCLLRQVSRIASTS